MHPGLGPVARHHPTGTSTGVFTGARNRWPSLARQACAVSAHAAELSALSEDELEGLEAFLAARPRLPFRYLSVHAPTKLVRTGEGALAARLGALPFAVRSIVLHPDMLGESGAYAALGRRAVIENMDPRKETGRTAQELEAAFAALPDAGFCFDIAHAHAVDPGLDAARELLDRWRGRLRQVHLSSLRGGEHVALTEEDEEAFAPLLARCSDVPWILEAAPPRRWACEQRVELAAVGELQAA